jgi:3-oxoacyl-[acyl-carrier protein] reductase
MTPSLSGKVAIVTGAARGIGRASALALARQGAAVAVVDVDAVGIAATAEAVAAYGGAAIGVVADISRPEQVQAMSDEVRGAFEGADILVNNAAIFPRSRVEDMAWEEWRHVLDVNLTGPFLCTKAVLPHMIARGGGRIVNVASGLGVTGGERAAHYSASKGGLIAFTKSLARELAPHGITANVLVPGLTDTEMPRSGNSPEAFAAMVAQIPLGRAAQPEEIAEFLAFLVGPGCGYVTGQTLFVNGGWIMP